MASLIGPSWFHEEPLHRRAAGWQQIGSLSQLTHWGRVTHICVSKLTSIGSDNGLSPGRRQAIIWTNGGILLIEPLGTNFSEILIAIHTFPFKKIHLKMSSSKWRPPCLGLNVLTALLRTFWNYFACWCTLQLLTTRGHSHLLQVLRYSYCFPPSPVICKI